MQRRIQSIRQLKVQEWQRAGSGCANMDRRVARLGERGSSGSTAQSHGCHHLFACNCSRCAPVRGPGRAAILHTKDRLGGPGSGAGVFGRFLHAQGTSTVRQGGCLSVASSSPGLNPVKTVNATPAHAAAAVDESTEAPSSPHPPRNRWTLPVCSVL